MKKKFSTSEDLRICRGCLATDVKLSILSNNSLKKSFSNFSGVKVSSKSLLFLCYKCLSMMRKFLQFQKMCGHTDSVFQKCCEILKKGTADDESISLLKLYKVNNLSHSNILLLDVCCIDSCRENNLLVAPCKAEDIAIHGDPRSNEEDYPAVDVYTNNNSRKAREKVQDKTLCEVEELDTKIEIKEEFNVEDDEYFSGDITEDDKDYLIENSDLNSKYVDNTFNADLSGQQQMERDGSSKHPVMKKSGEKLKLKVLNLYSCSYCPKMFKNKSSYKTHEKVHDGSTSHVCEECGKSFKSPAALKCHLVTHGATKSFVCEYCNKKFLHNNDLQRHIKIHTGEKDFICDFCGKAFTHVANLNTHRRLHLGIKPYRCELCGKSYSDNASMKYHKLTHTGEKPYKCKLCDATFRSTSELHAHETKHTGVKPHSCDKCSFSTVRLCNLKRHQQAHYRCAKEQRDIASQKVS